MRIINKIIDLVLVFSMLFLLFSFAIRTNAEQGNPFEQSVKVRCTCYVTSGTTASGQQTRPGIMASKREWIGCIACVNAVNPDGSVGEFIGYFEILDTGYGIETGVGQSKIFSDRTLGTIETGETVDVYCETMHQAEEWIDRYGDYVYIKLIKGVG